MLQIVLLALLARQDTPSTRFTVPLAVAVVASFIWLLYVSYLEHVRCVRPSTILCLYFGISALLDLARLRTLFFIPDYHITALVNLASYAVKLVLLVLEVTEKRSLLLWQWKDTSPEDVASYYSRVFFLWLNRVFIRGYNTRLTVDSLTPLDQEILTASRPMKLEQRWAKGESSLAEVILSMTSLFFNTHAL